MIEIMNSEFLVSLPIIKWMVLLTFVVGILKYWYRETFISGTGCKSYIPIPIINGFPIVGKAPHILKLTWPIEGVSPVVHVLQASLGVVLKLNFGRDGLLSTKWGNRIFVGFYKAKVVEALLSSNQHIEKSFVYDFMKPWLGNGLLLSKGHHWKVNRKMLTSAFHFKILNSFQPVMYEKSETMIQIITKKGGNFFHLEDVISLFTIDVICSTAMGMNLNCQKDGKNPYIQAFKRLGILLASRCVNPFLWLKWAFMLSSTGKEFYKCLDIIDSHVLRVITEKKEDFKTDPSKTDFRIDDHKGKLSFLDMIVLQHIHDPETISEMDIRDELNTFMFGGQDTTASGLVWCIFLLGNFPEEQQILYKEVTSVLGDDLTKDITTNDLKQMNYLDCVLKESQRLYPSINAIARTLTEDFVADKYLVKKGSECVVFLNALHMDPDVFPIPERFIPERFTPENSIGRSPYAYVPFSAGPRNCIGQRFALLEEKTAIANIVRNFRIVSKDHLDRIPVSPEIVSRPALPIYVKCISRV